MNFAERLSGLMAERGLSKLALAKKIGVSGRVVAVSYTHLTLPTTERV